MRIVHLVNELVVANGIVNVTVDLACGQSDAGHRVTVVSAGGHYESLLAQHGVTHHRLDIARRPPSGRVLISLARLLRSHRPEIVHAHTMSGAVLARILRGGRPYRVVTTVHNEYQRSAVLMGFGDCVVAVSEAVRSAMIARRVPASRIAVVRNGVIGSPRGVHCSPSPRPLHRPAVVTVAAVTRRKGIDVLVHAFDRAAQDIPDASLYIVGNRDWPEVESWAERLPTAARIHFPGRSDAVVDYLAAADVFVLASRREPLGLAVLEAREAKLPIIASNVDGLPEALDGGEAGLLVPPGDVDALAAALRHLLTDADARANWSAASGSGLEQWTVARMLGDYERLYQALLR